MHSTSAAGVLSRGPMDERHGSTPRSDIRRALTNNIACPLVRLLDQGTADAHMPLRLEGQPCCDKEFMTARFVMAITSDLFEECGPAPLRSCIRLNLPNSFHEGQNGTTAIPTMTKARPAKAGFAKPRV